jgi:hypothetical protein
MSPDDITAMWDAGLKALKVVHHQVGNLLVDINDGQADAFCYGIASHYPPDRTGNNTRTFVGNYGISLVQGGEQSRICKFRFNLKCIDGNQDLEGIAQAGTALSRRGVTVLENQLQRVTVTLLYSGTEFPAFPVEPGPQPVAFLRLGIANLQTV